MSERNFDLLLEYLTALGSGKWLSFKRATAEVAGAGFKGEMPAWVPSRVAENLGALGHVEFDFDGGLDWVVAPPTVATTPAISEGAGILCGARTDALACALQSKAEAKGIAISCSKQGLGPSVIELLADSPEDLEHLASEASIHFEYGAGAAILRALPSLQSMRVAAPLGSFLRGFPVDRWDVATLSWIPAADTSLDGSYRVNYWRPQYRLVVRGATKIVSQATAIYTAFAVAQSDVVNYDPTSRLLSVPARAYLPTLYARSLVLCSGALPVFDSASRTLRFSHVLPEFAKVIRERLSGLEDLRNE